MTENLTREYEVTLDLNHDGDIVHEVQRFRVCFSAIVEEFDVDTHRGNKVETEVEIIDEWVEQVGDAPKEIFYNDLGRIMIKHFREIAIECMEEEACGL